MSSDSSENPEYLTVLRSFRILVRAMRSQYQRIEKETGISGAHTWALSLIIDRPRMTVSELARAMAVHQSTASNLIDKLARLSLVERIKDSGDLRITFLVATPEARDRMNGATGPLSGELPAALARLPPAELHSLNASLGKLVAQLSQVEAEAGDIPLAYILSDGHHNPEA